MMYINLEITGHFFMNFFYAKSFHPTGNGSVLNIVKFFIFDYNKSIKKEGKTGYGGI